MLSGYELGVITDDIWYVPNKFYKLSKIKMWKNDSNTAGFQVTYSPKDDFTGWPDEVHMFGFDDVTSHIDEILF